MNKLILIVPARFQRGCAAKARRRSSITELAFHGIHTSRLQKSESVTHVSGTKCHLCLGPLKPTLPRSVNAPGVTSGVTAPTSRTPFGEALRVVSAARGIQDSN
jgi:hypothetical protein